LSQLFLKACKCAPSGNGRAECSDRRSGRNGHPSPAWALSAHSCCPLGTPFDIRAGDVQYWQKHDDESIRRTYRSIPRYCLDVKVRNGHGYIPTGAARPAVGGNARKTKSGPRFLLLVLRDTGDSITSNQVLKTVFKSLLACMLLFRQNSCFGDFHLPAVPRSKFLAFQPEGRDRSRSSTGFTSEEAQILMSTFVLVHGAWQTASTWDLVGPQLLEAGHCPPRPFAMVGNLPKRNFEGT
jgi:hypothetical protein